MGLKKRSLSFIIRMYKRFSRKYFSEVKYLWRTVKDLLFPNNTLKHKSCCTHRYSSSLFIKHKSNTSKRSSLQKLAARHCARWVSGTAKSHFCSNTTSAMSNKPSALTSPLINDGFSNGCGCAPWSLYLLFMDTLKVTYTDNTINNSYMVTLCLMVGLKWCTIMIDIS